MTTSYTAAELEHYINRLKRRIRAGQQSVESARARMIQAADTYAQESSALATVKAELNEAEEQRNNARNQPPT